ncbi:MAG: DUF1489 domain-containing protein [Rhodospirillales bacterium]|nr:DUF1489 domain-containing protein [Rhodospirillales bacterium]
MHLLKLAVGIDTVAHLREAQGRRRGAAPTVSHVTRHTPKRATELLDGGSLYWVIRGVIRVRQRLVGIEPASTSALAGDGGGGEGPAPTSARTCRLLLDPVLTPTVPRGHRAFQGWRYLRSEDAPADAPADVSAAAGEGADGGTETTGGLPAAMVAELARLGLL